MEPPPGQEVVEAGYKGLQREVLTPGTYKINPQQYEVTLYSASVVPPGSVGIANFTPAASRKDCAVTTRAVCA